MPGGDRPAGRGRAEHVGFERAASGVGIPNSTSSSATGRTGESPWSDGLVAAIREGQVSEATVDEKVMRLLRLAAGVGALDGVVPLVDPGTLSAPPEPDVPAVRSVLRRAAALGTVLLRNEGGLGPLSVAKEGAPQTTYM
jgi:beta-glucosidase-like glycosyl hydrolase